MATVTLVRDEADFTDLSVRIGGVSPFIGIDSISWSDDLDVTEVRGTGGRLVGIVHGAYSARGSVTLPVSEEESFLRDANGGESRLSLGNEPEVWTVSCGKGRASYTLQDVILTGRRVSHSQRSGVLVVSYDMRMSRVVTDGFTHPLD